MDVTLDDKGLRRLLWLNQGSSLRKCIVELCVGCLAGDLNKANKNRHVKYIYG